jgi:hypothetical protein
MTEPTTDTPPSDRWLTEQQAQAYLKISQSTLRRRATEAGAVFKVGARVLYDRTVLDTIPQPTAAPTADEPPTPE